MVTAVNRVVVGSSPTGADCSVAQLVEHLTPRAIHIRANTAGPAETGIAWRGTVEQGTAGTERTNGRVEAERLLFWTAERGFESHTAKAVGVQASTRHSRGRTYPAYMREKQHEGRGYRITDLGAGAGRREGASPSCPFAGGGGMSRRASKGSGPQTHPRGARDRAKATVLCCI